MLQTLEEFKTALLNLVNAIANYNRNLQNTSNRNWARDVESCRLKVKAALEKAIAKLSELRMKLEQFKIDSVKNAQMDKDGVFKMDDAAKRSVERVERWMRLSERALEEADTITREF